MLKFFLREPSLKEKEQVLEMYYEMLSMIDDHRFAGTSGIDDVVRESYEAWLNRCNEEKKQNIINYLLVDSNDKVYGMCQLRNNLTEDLQKLGGNISYAIKPSERHKGYGYKLLMMLLRQAKVNGLGKVLLTCRENNIASKNLIEKCGGVQIESTPSNYDNIKELRYWIDLKNIY